MANLFRCGSNQNSNLSCKLLWTNSNPTSLFLAQKINLDLSSYKSVIIEFYGQIGSGNNYVFTRPTILKNEAKQVAVVANGAGFYRNITMENDGVTVSTGYYNNGNSGYNDYVIPYKIYGSNNTF